MNEYQYVKYNPEIMNKVIDYLGDIKIENILDIGAGIANDSKHLQRTYDSEIWILEGDSKNNVKKSPDVRKAKWNNSADDMSYYWSLEDLKAVHERKTTKKYHIVDCDNIILPSDIKFDLISSYLSCGFHYPISTYYNLIKKYSHNNTRCIFDIRLGKGQQPVLDPEVEIVKIIHQTKKYARCEIKFNF
jgi:hypothetical protein